jgi:predicted nucleic acid-binding protein
MLAGIGWRILPVPSGERLETYTSLIDAKDLHVLAAAVEGESDFLLTLDRRHILAAVERVKEAGLPIQILTPGDFIRRIYPWHEAYASLPPPRDR